MTRDRRRKKAVRAHAAATGRRYADAATHLSLAHSATPRKAEDLRTALSAEFRARGWPTDQPHEFSDYLILDAGPVELCIRRAMESRRDDLPVSHPDNPSCYDLDSPLLLDATAPHYADMHGKPMRERGMEELEFQGDQPVRHIVDVIEREVRAARRLDTSRVPLTGRCDVCGDRYAPTGLLDPADSPIRTCPCCVFHVEVPGADPVGLGAQLNRRLKDCLSLPAVWNAVQVLLACLGGPGLVAGIDAKLTTRAGKEPPLPQWHDPTTAWIWLPSASHRPTVLTRFRGLASLADLIAEIDRHHPDLRQTVRAGAQRYNLYLETRPGVYRSLPETVDRLWPALVAYSVSLLAQHAERPQHRSPWHAMDPMDLRAWVKSLDRSLNHTMVETVMNEGILTVANTLTRGLPIDSDTDDRP